MLHVQWRIQVEATANLCCEPLSSYEFEDGREDEDEEDGEGGGLARRL